MDIRNSPTRYGIVAKLFHWTVALIIVGMLTAGFSLNYIHSDAIKNQIIFYHKSFGLLLLMLVILRLLWRWFTPAPAFPSSMPSWRGKAAHTSHFILYCLIILMPLDGILMSTFYGYPPSFFGLFQLPQFVPINKSLSAILAQGHLIIAWTIIVVVSIHILAALEHQFIRKDGILKRML